MKHGDMIRAAAPLLRARVIFLAPGNENSPGNAMKQFRREFTASQGYDPTMNFTFMAPGIGLCLVTLWATGRYGFSLPKKVEIRTPEGEISTFLYVNRKLRLRAELSNRAIVKIAIARFLDGARGRTAPVEIEPDVR